MRSSQVRPFASCQHLGSDSAGRLPNSELHHTAPVGTNVRSTTLRLSCAVICLLGMLYSSRVMAEPLSGHLRVRPLVRFTAPAATLYGPPSLIRLEDNRLLLLYTSVPSHKTDEQGEPPSAPKQTIQIAMRTSADNGSTWSAERTIAELPVSASSATSAKGPVQRQSQLPLLTTALAGDERINLWITLPEQASLWAWSTDHGDTWTAPQPFAPAADGLAHRVSDVISTPEGLFLISAGAPASKQPASAASAKPSTSPATPSDATPAPGTTPPATAPSSADPTAASRSAEAAQSGNQGTAASASEPTTTSGKQAASEAPRAGSKPNDPPATGKKTSSPAPPKTTKNTWQLWHSADHGQSWQPRKPLAIEARWAQAAATLLWKKPDGRLHCLLSKQMPKGGYEHVYFISPDHGNSWEQTKPPWHTSEGVIRPQLLAMGDHHRLLAGFDARAGQIATFISGDGNLAFNQRQILDTPGIDSLIPEPLVTTAALPGQDLAIDAMAESVGVSLLVRSPEQMLIAWNSLGTTALPRSEIKLARLSFIKESDKGWVNLRANDSAAWKIAGDWRSGGALRIAPDNLHRLLTDEGNSVLVNGVNGQTANLRSQLEHGDVELYLEYALAKETRSGIYLQGRYEVRLTDVATRGGPLSAAHNGGLAERHDPVLEPAAPGYAPAVDASAAPGQWQSLSLVFRAPRFDTQGKKTMPATFERVVLNGREIHQHVEISGPTEGSVFEDEASLGPLIIRGDGGPVAIRNIRWRRLSPQM